jgi:hypothetical protein
MRSVGLSDSIALGRVTALGSTRLLFCIVLGCASPSPAARGPGPTSSPSTAHQAMAPTTPHPSASAAPTTRAPLPLDGCAARLDLALAGPTKLQRLAEACITGMQPIWPEPWLVEATGEVAREKAVLVPDSSRCLRAGAAADATVADIELSLVGPDGRPLAQDDLNGSVALVGLHGPVCPEQAGAHSLRIRTAGGGGRVATQVWRAE